MNARSRFRGAASQVVEAFHYGAEGRSGAGRPADPHRSTGARVDPGRTGDATPTPRGVDAATDPTAGLLEEPFPIGRLTPGPNPVLTAADVTDYGDVDFVADPFLLPGEGGSWHMFMEVYNDQASPTGVIGHATSPDGFDWAYDGVVLRADFHLSFPYVFEHRGRRFMLPEQGRPPGAATVRLYEADPFPDRWRPVADLVAPEHATNDHVAFEWGGRWWLFVGDMAAGQLYAYHSDRLDAEGWQSHEANPMVTDRPDVVRPAGRPLVYDDRILAFFQDCGDQYGDAVRAFTIDELTPTTYRDRELPGSPLLAGRGLRGWNSGRMHHIDPWFTGAGWLCAVDGDIGLGRRYTGEKWSIGVLGGRNRA